MSSKSRTRQAVWGWVFWLWFSTTPAFTLDPTKGLTQYALRFWSLEEGLPQASVLAITQTPDGYLWIGTVAGLSRFDGFRFVVPPAARELPPGAVRGLAVDSEGALWITAAGRLYVLAGQELGESLLEGASVSGAVHVVAKQGGGVWVSRAADPVLTATAAGGAEVFRDRDGRLIENAARIADDAGFACFAGERLLCLEDGRLEEGARIETLAPTTQRLGPIDISSDGSVWVGTMGDGVVRLRPDTSERGQPDRVVERDSIRSLLADRNSNIWFPSSFSGLARFDGTTLQVLPDLRQVMALFEDRAGNLWVGTNNDGLARLRDRSISVVSQAEGLPLPTVQSVLETTDGTVWIGTAGGGLVAMRGSHIVATYGLEQGLPGLEVMALTEDRRGRLLVGTGDGPARLDGERFQTLPTSGPRPTFSLFEDSAGTLWGGFVGSLRRFQSGHFVDVGWGQNMHVVAIAETGDGTVWFGGTGGLLRAPGGARPLGDDPANPRARVLSLLADGNDLWVGTFGGGLGRLSRGEYSSFDSKHGLCDDDVFAILGDDAGQLWMSSNRGIFVVDKAEAIATLTGGQQDISCRLIGVDDGLRSREATGGRQPSAWRAADGSLWFTTINGAVHIDPVAFLEQPLAPPVLIEGLFTADRGVEPVRRTGASSRGLRLTPEQREFSIEYTALHLGAPESLEFRYRLAGLESEWVNAGARRTAQYARVEPGTYTFEVAARLKHSEAWSEPTKLAITLEPRFRETKLFVGLIAGAISLLLLGLHQLRLSRLRIRQRELETAVHQRTLELEEARRDLQLANTTLHRRVEEGVEALRQSDRMAAYGHMVAGVAHELRHPIASIQGLAHLLSLKQPTGGETAQELGLLLEETERIQHLFDELLELARPAKPELVPSDPNTLVRAAVESYRASRATEAAQIPVELSQAPALPRIGAEPEKLIQVLINLIVNAQSHAEGATHIEVRTAASPEHGSPRFVRIEVCDDGAGIPESLRASIFEPFVSRPGSHGTGLGLAVARKAVQGHAGKLTLEPTDRGSTFVIELPVLPLP